MNLLRPCLLLLAVSLPTRALAAPADEPAPVDESAVTVATVRLELTTDDGDPAFAARLEERVVDLLAVRGRSVAEDADFLVAVTVSLDAEDPGIYRTRVDGSGTAVEPFVSVTEPCQRCGAEQIVAQLGRQLDGALLHLERSAAAVADEAGPRPERVGEDPPPPPPAPSKRLGAMGIAGIAVLGTGFAATATGAGLWARGSLPHPDRPDWLLRTRPPGIAMVAAGAAGMVTGGVLIAVDLRRHRVPQHAVAPLLAPGVAGVNVSGRF